MTQLNPQQLAAVTTVDCPLLVLAGAGSGKTRVITEKIAYLIRQGMAARHLVAVTFTNKAAREMKSRVAQLLEDRETHGLTVSTFHALGLEILRREHRILGFKPNLSVFDEQDRLALLRELIRHGVDRYHLDRAEDYANRISRWKNRFIPPEIAMTGGDSAECDAAVLYQDYMRHMKAYNAVDFDDLILLPVLLFQKDPEVLEQWRNRIRYLLVDEYQDTNRTQYELLKLLTGSLGKFTVVGDDDQSIYAWRGAQPENLAQLRADFPHLKVIKLEQNYRSVGRILKVANRLIGNNPHLFEKRLWSAMDHGDPIRVLQHSDEVAEARQIAADIIHHKFRHGARFGDYVILYRGNHQSRLFERAFRESGIPYHLGGNISFFGFAEVKDVMAYLRLLVNPDDDAAFLRIVNVPRREIGPTTLEKLGQYASRRHLSLFSTCFELGLEQVLPASAVQRLRNFCQIITDTAHRIARGDPFQAIDGFFTSIGYPQWVRENSKDSKAAERKQGNVRELLDWLRRLAESEDRPRSLAETLARAMLLDVLDRDQQDNTGDRVSLMTLHAAKGLEFPYVYLVGMEENLIPHQTSIEENNVEEERRLAYVGITRARRHLTLSYCRHRKRHGELVACQPSRFLSELPPEELEWSERESLDPETKRERGRTSIAQLRSLLSDS